MNIPPLTINKPQSNNNYNNMLPKSSSSKYVLTPLKQFVNYPSFQFKKINKSTTKKIGVSLGPKLKKLVLILSKPKNSVPKIIDSPCLLLNELKKDTKSNFNNKYNFLIKKEPKGNCLFPLLNSSSTIIVRSNSIVKSLFSNKNNHIQQKQKARDEFNSNDKLLHNKKKLAVYLLFESKQNKSN